MNLLIRRTTAYAAQHHFLNAHRISRAEYSTYVMLTAHVVQDHHQRQFVRFAVLVHIHATHFCCRQFFTHNAKGKCTRSTCASSSISKMKSSCSGTNRPSSSVASVLMVDSSTAAIVPISVHAPSSPSSIIT